MKLQKIAILLAAMGLVVALETVLSRSLVREDTAAAVPPVATQTAATPEATLPLGSAAPVNTIAPIAPGYTSPPAYNPNSAPTQKPAQESSPTQRPEPTQAPAPDPTEPPPPTPEPTEPPEGSIGSTLSSGNFASSTGTGLNISIAWKATNLGDGKARIAINGSVNSYSLSVMSLPVSISFGNYSASVTGSSINVPNDTITSNSLFSTSIDVDAGYAGTMTVSWSFNGEYSGVALSDITASGYVYT